MTLFDCISVLRERFVPILISVVLITGCAALAACTLMDDEYEATALVSATSSSSSDVSAGSSVLAAVDDELYRAAADAAGIDGSDSYSVEAKTQTNTGIVRITVTGLDAKTTAVYANAIAEAAAKEGATGDIDAQVSSPAEEPNAPSGPKRVYIVAMAFLTSVVCSCSVVLIAYIGRENSAHAQSRLSLGKRPQR